MQGIRHILGKLLLVFHPRVAVVLHDLFMVWAAWTLMLWLRYSFDPYPPDIPLVSVEHAVVLASQALIFWWTGLYRGLWRFASMPDLLNIVRACVAGALLISAGLFLLNRLEGVPRSGLFIYPVFLSFLLGAPRLIYRFWKDLRLAMHAAGVRPRVLILGAGRAGEMLVRDMRREGAYQPVGFLDDNPKLAGSRMHGIPVLGPIERLPTVARETAADTVIIAMPSASNAQMQRVVRVCEDSGVVFRTLPRMQDMLSGRATFNELREVAIDDLLGRDPVRLDWDAIGRSLAGRRVLVTGGGGSIGGELCRQVARLDPECLVILELSEYNLYSIERELKREFPDLALDSVLGDVCDRATVDYVMARFQPEVVFHAAAFKHVPLLEDQLREAVRNNIIGTEVVARGADHHGVETFVLISTDKAVNPVNVMGRTKRVAELFCQNFAERSRTRFIAVRFGNVLNSAGSVVPVFREQIQHGGPVTVTHPDVCRYFMTIPEACQLIMQAGVLGEGGEIFVLDMGEPIRIRFLAEQMIRLAGFEPGRDIEIVYTGLRAGEKLSEELFYAQETHGETSHEKILLARHEGLDWQVFHQRLAELHQACVAFDSGKLETLMRRLIPEQHDAGSGAEEKVVPLARTEN